MGETETIRGKKPKERRDTGNDRRTLEGSCRGSRGRNGPRRRLTEGEEGHLLTEPQRYGGRRGNSVDYGEQRV